MEYVNVPVPEAHVEAVERFIPWAGTQVVPDDIDPATVDRMLEIVDETARSYLVALALAHERSDALTLTESARKAGITPREAIGVVAEVNDVSVRIGGAGMIVFIQGVDGDEAREAGGADVIGDRKVVRIQGWVADRVLRQSNVGRLVSGDDTS